MHEQRVAITLGQSLGIPTRAGVLQQMPASSVKWWKVVVCLGTSPQKPPEPLAKSLHVVQSRACRALADLAAEPEL